MTTDRDDALFHITRFRGSDPVGPTIGAYEDGLDLESFEQLRT